MHAFPGVSDPCIRTVYHLDLLIFGLSLAILGEG